MGVLVHDDVHAASVAHPDFLVGKSHIGDAQRSPRGYVDGEAAVEVGDNALARSFYQDAGSHHRFALLIGDDAAHFAGPVGGRGRLAGILLRAGLLFFLENDNRLVRHDSVGEVAVPEAPVEDGAHLGFLHGEGDVLLRVNLSVEVRETVGSLPLNLIEDIDESGILQSHGDEIGLC